MESRLALTDTGPSEVNTSCDVSLLAQESSWVLKGVFLMVGGVYRLDNVIILTSCKSF